MKTQLSILRGLWLFALALSVLTAVPAAFAQGTTAFTYQGQLRDGGTNANGTYSMVFKLHDAASSGNQVGSTLTLGSQFVTNGMFSASLDFGPVFDGSARWLELTVAGNVLSPRTLLAPTPYALYATKAGSVSNPTFLGTTGNTPLDLFVNNIRVLRLEPHENSPNFIGGYVGNVINNGSGSVIVGGGGGVDEEDGLLSPNTIRSSYSFIGGGARNTVTKTGGLIVGGFKNNVSGDSAVIVGGEGNTNSGNGGFVGGGSHNTVTADSGVITGGSGNRVDGDGSFIGGGETNSTSGFSAVVAGGKNNLASGNQSFIGGGEGNVASGDYSTIMGGNNNVASANFSFAGGVNAHATHQGTFVWSADGSASFNSATIGEFAVRAPGGFRLLCGAGSLTMLSSDLTFNGTMNATTFHQLSDRNAKQDFAQVDGRAVLAKVVALPIQTWNYKQDLNTRHIGPMAQDFFSAFQVGPDEKHIATVDADGVALAAIQGLNEVVKEKDAEIALLKQRLDSLEKAVSGLVNQQKGGVQ